MPKISKVSAFIKMIEFQKEANIIKFKTNIIKYKIKILNEIINKSLEEDKKNNIYTSEIEISEEDFNIITK